MSHVGKYQLIRELATGGMAKVFLARAAGPHGFAKTLVLKSILPSLTEDPSFVEMFLTEARLAAQLNHPNIAQIYELGEEAGTYFIAMEYVDGPNLRTLRKRARELGRPLPFAVIAKVLSQACEALAFAHAFADPETGLPLELVHRDVSPDNILVSRSGVVKLVDFGIAKASGSQPAHLTKPGSLKGKLAYMPPEQIRGEVLDARADLYALGVVLYELLTDTRPHSTGQSKFSSSDAQMMHAILYEPFVPVTERRPDVPEVLRRILERCMAKQREERYADCHELQTDLEAFISLSSEPVGAQRLAQVVNELVPPEPLEGRGTPAPLTSLSGSVSRGRVTPPAPMTPPPVLQGRPLREEAGTPRRSVTGAQQRPPPLPPPGPKKGGALRWAVPAAGAALLVAGGGFLSFRSGSLSALTTSAPASPEPVAAAAVLPQETAEAAVPAVAGQGEAPEPVPAPEAAPVQPDAAATPPAAPAEEREPRRVERRSAERRSAERRSAPRQAQAQASLAVECNVPAQVRLNGRPVGQTPLTLRDLAPGRVKVEVLDPQGGFRKSEVLELQPGDGAVQRFTVEEGTLEFRIRPYATVILDGKLLGQTPLKVSAYEGPHDITLVNRDLGKEVKLTHVVKPGQLNVVKYVLDE